MSKAYREESRQDWSMGQEWEDPTNDALKVGCLQRIADATEAMAKNYTQCQNDRDLYKRRWEEAKAGIAKRDRRIAALQGVITRMKRKAGAK